MADDHVLDNDFDAVLRLPSTCRILKTVCAMTGLRFAAIARSTSKGLVICACVDEIGFGLTVGDMIAFGEAPCPGLSNQDLLVAESDGSSPGRDRSGWILAGHRIESYLSVPISCRNGGLFGTLCGFDTEPRRIDTPAVRETAALFADLISAQLDAQRELARRDDDLADERALSRLREEFLAVLGHDLRNPVQAIQAGARLLAREPQRDDALEIIQKIGVSASRMETMIRDLLDLAKCRLAGGLPVDRDPAADLRSEFEQVVAEIEAVTHRGICSDFVIDRLDCDRARMGQLLSNLVSNAVTHGTPGTEVRIEAKVLDGVFRLTVSNGSPPIPAAILHGLFQPFSRGEDSKGSGIGLGLYIASEIARAHGGHLTAEMQDGLVIFTMTMPVGAAARQGKPVTQSASSKSR
ncbi:GAF domain-containing sensor histidine kinase (plasmid) [Limimaricola variabilis]|uniref:sensor histidine kinase n=1 Tax=Limimaricola variabilis TaxID=1492771 RepID=UPI002AC91D3D|nr:GAF domain-containing sensor histidine kinase [Limimaricola variabilis]WPY96560.1 GAF domain-containing sensor histidine kinase [Limimaricola variabilis]